MFAMFNWAFQSGGSACTIRTVEKLTDIRIDHHMVVDFHGFKDMVDAVDGVEVCLKEPIDDPPPSSGCPPGKVTLNGEQALGYVRARKTIGDGSDTDRMDRQQRFLGALVNKVRSNDVLLNPVKLYPVLDAATSSLTTDPGLASLRGLYELVRGMRNIPTERVQFLTVPRESYAYNANRDQLVEPEAEKLFERLRTDAPLEVAKELPEDSGTKRSSAERSATRTRTAIRATTSPMTGLTTGDGGRERNRPGRRQIGCKAARRALAATESRADFPREHGRRGRVRLTARTGLQVKGTPRRRTYVQRIGRIARL